MPTYDYKCADCGGEFEYFHGISAPPMTKCEACGGRLERLLSAGTGLIFKGSGFYITDYKGGKPGSAGGENKPAGDSKPTGGTTESAPSNTLAPAAGTESKPAAAPVPAPTKPSAD